MPVRGSGSFMQPSKTLCTLLFAASVLWGSAVLKAGSPPNTAIPAAWVEPRPQIWVAIPHLQHTIERFEKAGLGGVIPSVLQRLGKAQNSGGALILYGNRQHFPAGFAMQADADVDARLASVGFTMQRRADDSAATHTAPKTAEKGKRAKATSHSNVIFRPNPDVLWGVFDADPTRVRAPTVKPDPSLATDPRSSLTALNLAGSSMDAAAIGRIDVANIFGSIAKEQTGRRTAALIEMAGFADLRALNVLVGTPARLLLGNGGSAVELKLRVNVDMPTHKKSKGLWKAAAPGRLMLRDNKGLVKNGKLDGMLAAQVRPVELLSVFERMFGYLKPLAYGAYDVQLRMVSEHAGISLIAALGKNARPMYFMHKGTDSIFALELSTDQLKNLKHWLTVLQKDLGGRMRIKKRGGAVYYSLHNSGMRLPDVAIRNGLFLVGAGHLLKNFEKPLLETIESRALPVVVSGVQRIGGGARTGIARIDRMLSAKSLREGAGIATWQMRYDAEYGYIVDINAQLAPR